MSTTETGQAETQDPDRGPEPDHLDHRGGSATSVAADRDPALSPAADHANPATTSPVPTVRRFKTASPSPTEPSRERTSGGSSSPTSVRPATGSSVALPQARGS